jgi:hypothetical protein
VQLAYADEWLTSAMSMRLFIGFDGISAAETYGERVICVVLSLRISADRLEAEIVPAYRLGGLFGDLATVLR